MNPKAETVEELQRRRKGLHLGMCKLLREDLSIMAEQRATVKDQEVHTALRFGLANSPSRALLPVAKSKLSKMGCAI